MTNLFSLDSTAYFTLRALQYSYPPRRILIYLHAIGFLDQLLGALLIRKQDSS
jgi:hypothetical protein